MIEVDAVVVGTGVVGLATAAALARTGRSAVVLERLPGIAREASSRNSGVLHAGFYYPPGSAKALLCVRGSALLAERCAAHRIACRRTGKLVVAVEPAELPVLEDLHRRGVANGVAGLEQIGAEAVARLEPEVRALAALWSPGSGIVDAGALARSFAAEAEAHGAVLAPGHELVAVERSGDGYRVTARDHSAHADVGLRASAVVNAAGLSADAVAARAGLDVDARGLRQRPCKGDWFCLAPGRHLAVSHLVYPVPAGPGLGIHVTLDVAGRVRFGPDAEYVETPRYDVDPAKAGEFARAVGRYLPRVREDWLVADEAGVRAKLAGPGETFRDFEIVEESASGLPGFVNLVGIESPGLTAAPAIAERVVSLLA